MKSEPIGCISLHVVKAAKKAERCGTKITLQNLAGLHLGKFGTFEVLNIVKIILAALSSQELAEGAQQTLMSFSP